MIARLLVVAFICSSLLGDLTKDIKKAKNDLSKNSTKSKNISNNLNSLAKKISTYKASLKQVKIGIRNLNNEILSYKKQGKTSTTKLNKINSIYKKLKDSNDIVNKKLVSILSKEIYTSILLQHNSTVDTNSINSLIESEFLATYSGILKDKFNKTKLKFFKLKVDLALVTKELNKINSKLTTLESKKNKLNRLKKFKDENLNKLELTKKSYLDKLRQVRRENRELKKILTKLNIIKKENEVIAEEIDKPQSAPTSPADLNVRQVGNSYSRTPVKKYHGKKTIAPFKKYKISRKFGNFTDPTYKIKMFNPNIVLKPIGNKNVINVLDGKVISITKSPAIGSIIIIDNNNQIHTLYAKLSKVAPTIKVGNRVKKGYILGKVKNELFFEVTKNNSNINPLELIN